MWEICNNILPVADEAMVVATVFCCIIEDPIRGSVKTTDVALFINVYKWEGSERASVSAMEISFKDPLMGNVLARLGLTLFRAKLAVKSHLLPSKGSSSAVALKYAKRLFDSFITKASYIWPAIITTFFNTIYLIVCIRAMF